MPPKRKTQAEKDAAETALAAARRTVKYDTAQYTVEHLVRQFQDNEFYIPDYQRQFVWDQSRKGRFIESVLIGYPIPFLFLANMPDGRLEIVDGAQRIQTLTSFLTGQFRLQGLKALPPLNGFRFEDLPVPVQRRLKGRSLRMIILEEETDSTVRRQMFDRINTTSLKANEMEVRAGSKPGPFLDLIQELAKNKLFKSLAPVSKGKAKRRESEELVLRFFAYTDRYTEFSHEVGPFLDNYLSDMNAASQVDDAVVRSHRETFLNMLSFVQRNFPHGMAKPGGKSTPRVRFEAIAVGVALAQRAQPSLPDQDTKWTNEADFKRVTTSDQSNTKSRLMSRLEFVRDKLLGPL